MSDVILAQYILIQIDPILKSLLHNLKQHTLQKWQQTERLLTALLDRIRASTQQQQQDSAQALASLFDYWSLPFVALLKMHSQQQSQFDNEMLFSAWIHLQTHAVTVLYNIIEIMHDCNASIEFGSTDRLLNLTVAIVMILPSGKELQDSDCKVVVNNETVLYWTKLWNCLYKLCKVAVSSSVSSEYIKAISATANVNSSIYAMILPRLVDAAVATLLLQQQQQYYYSLQIQALDTLQVWMSYFSCRFVFPGVFTGLVKPAMTMIRRQSKQRQVLVAILQTLSRLLQTTVVSSQKATKVDSSSNNVMQQLSVLAQNVNNKADSSTGRQSKNNAQDAKFIKQVKTRLPLPLTMLIEQILKTKSLCNDTVKLAVLDLCRIIVVDSKSIWSDDNSEKDATAASDDVNLYQCAFETVLSLSQDEDTNVAIRARKITDKVLSSIPDVTVLVDRMLTVWLQELPALIRGRKQNEVYTQLQKCNATLDAIANRLKHVKLLKKVRVALNVAIATSSSSNAANSIFALFDIDFDTIVSENYQAQTEPKVVVLVSGDSCAEQSPPTLPPYTKHSTTRVDEQAIKMVQLLAKVLGTKYTIRWIDALCYRVYESSVSSHDKVTVDTTNDIDLSGSYIAWLHDSVSALSLARHLLSGIVVNQSSTDGEEALIRHLNTLALAITPSLFSPYIWTCDIQRFETPFGNSQRADQTGVYTSATASLALRSRGQYALLYQICMIVIACFDVDKRIADDLLSTVVVPLLVTSLVQENKGSDDNTVNTTRKTSLIQDLSKYTLYKVSQCCGYKDTPEMLCDNIEMVVSTIMRDYRLTSKTDTNRTDATPQGIAQTDVGRYNKTYHNDYDKNWSTFTTVTAVTVYLLKCILLQTVDGLNTKESDKRTKNFGNLTDTVNGNVQGVNWSYLNTLVENIVYRLDRLQNRIKKDEDKALVVVQLFLQLFASMYHSYTQVSNSTNHSRHENDNQATSESEGNASKDSDTIQACWYNLLSSYRKSSRNKGKNSNIDLATDDIDRSPAVTATTVSQDNEDTDTDSDSNSDSNQETPKLPKYEYEAELTARLLHRLCHLLSHDSLKVQIEAFRATSQAFTFLHWLGKTQEVCKSDGDQELNGTRTAILRHIADAWYALAARMEALTMEVTRTTSTAAATMTTTKYMNRTTLLLVSGSDINPGRDSTNGSSSSDPLSSSSYVTSIGEKKLFLSELCGLVALMANLSEDFMISRLREQVLPTAVRLLSYYTRTTEAVHNNTPSLTKISSASTTVSLQRTTAPRLSQSEHSVKDGTQLRMNSQHDHTTTPTSSPRSVDDTIKSGSFIPANNDRRLAISCLSMLQKLYSNALIGPSLTTPTSMFTKLGKLLLDFPIPSASLQDIVLEEAVVDTLQSMLRVDCDFLWRHLNNRAGFKLSVVHSCSLSLLHFDSNDSGNMSVRDNKVYTNNNADTAVADINTAEQIVQPPAQLNNVVRERAIKLIAYVDSLPEQAIL